MKFLYLFIAACVGAAVFWFYFDTRILDPANVEWLFVNGGDGMQHYLGSYAFRSDAWHFPITRTTWICYPEGVSIIYTDSNPLLSIIAKLIRPVFPPEYQFFGIWFLLCWILQGVFGFLLIRKLTNNSVYALLGAVLFCFLPAQIDRLGHANLVAFWLIIWSVYVYINDELSAGKRIFLFFMIALIASMIHAYLCNMCLIVAMSWGVRYLLKLYKNRKEADGKRRLYAFIGQTVGYFMVFLVFIWSLGYFYNRPDSTGLLSFGYFSMNLLSPVNSIYQGVFQLPVFKVMEGQYEGYNYLGFGILMLIVLAVVLGSRKKRLWPLSWWVWVLMLIAAGFVLFFKSGSLSYGAKLTGICIITIYVYSFSLVRQTGKRSLFWLILPATVCFMIALSHKGYLADGRLYTIRIDENAFYSVFLRMMRSSGRFFWVTSIIWVTVALCLIYYLIRNKTLASLVLVIGIVAQVTDMSHRYKAVKAEINGYANPLEDNEKEMIRKARFINFFGEVDMRVAEYALLNNVKINNFNTAHAEGKLTKRQVQYSQKSFAPVQSDTMYLFQISDLGLNKAYGLTNRFYGGYFVLPPHGFSLDDPQMYMTRIEIDTLSSLIELVKTKPMVVLTVADEVSLNMNPFFTQCMDSEYGTTMRHIKYRDSYLAVFVEGKLYQELRSETESVFLSDTILNQMVYVKSIGDEKNERAGALIRINATELHLNYRGLNVLVLDSTKISGLNHYQFSNLDTHAFYYPF